MNGSINPCMVGGESMSNGSNTKPAAKKPEVKKPDTKKAAAKKK
jgi:hypothetical protein